MVLHQVENKIKLFFVPLLVFALYLIFPREQYLGAFLSEFVCIVSIVIFLLYVRTPALYATGVAIMVVTVIVSANLEARITMLSNLALTFVLLQYIEKESVAKLLIAGLVIAVVILLASYFSYFFLWEYEAYPPGLSFFGSKVGLINILVMALYSLNYFYYGSKTKQGKALLCIAIVLVLCSLFLTLSKQVFVAILVAFFFFTPLLWIKSRRSDVVIYVSVVIVSYVIFNQFAGELLKDRIKKLNLAQTISSSDTRMLATKMALEELPVIGDEGVKMQHHGVHECQKAVNYQGCIINHVLCREDYLSGYIRMSESYSDLAEKFFAKHVQLGGYLSTDEAKFRWLSGCSKQIITTDPSDRFVIMRKGLASISSVGLRGFENPINFKVVKWSAYSLETYHSFHNFIFDFPYYYGSVYSILFLFLLVLSIMYAVRDDLNFATLGSMLVAFVVLRLFSGGIYEMFYIILLMAIILYEQYTDTVK